MHILGKGINHTGIDREHYILHIILFIMSFVTLIDERGYLGFGNFPIGCLSLIFYPWLFLYWYVKFGVRNLFSRNPELLRLVYRMGHGLPIK